MKQLAVFLLVCCAFFALAGTAHAQTPTVTPSPTPTAIPLVITETVAVANVCFYDPDDMGFLDDLDTIESSIASLQAQISSGNASVTIDDNPFSIAAGYVVLMGQVSWFAILSFWFTAAFITIITVKAIRFIVSSRGVVEFVMSVIKLLPFIG